MSRKTNKPLLTALIVGLLAMGCPQQADAQFLDKLNKGLEKLNKGLDKVENALKGKKSKNKTKTNPKASTQQEAPNAALNEANATPTTSSSLEQQPTITAIHLSADTRFVQRKALWDNMSDVSEGIFSIQEYNRKIGYASYFGFWTVDGRCLFPAQYEMFGEKPRFNSGACVVKNADAKNRHGIILYADGRTRELSKEWAKVTQFYDGVAMVSERSGSINHFYINTKGEKIWPHLSDKVTMANKGTDHTYMRPIKEGMRAYYSNIEKAWGFLDEKGNVVIKPQFSAVRDFAGGYALAFIPKYKGSFDGKPIFIDRKGATVLEIPYNAPNLQYAAIISDISDGCFSIAFPNDATVFYDLTGKELKRYGLASWFHKGTSATRADKYDFEGPVYIVNRNFDIAGIFPIWDSEFGVNLPKFDQAPYYTYRQRVVINEQYQPVLYVPYRFDSHNAIGQFSSDGYAKASMVIKDRNTNKEYLYLGVIDPSGAFTMVFNEDDKARGPFEEQLDGSGNCIGIVIVDPPAPPQDPDDDTTDDLPKILLTADTIPIGPTTNTPATYEVTVNAYPEGSAKVYGTGKYAYGDTIRVTGTIAKGWTLSSIDVNKESARTETFNKFVVNGRLEITCNFVKEDTIIDVPNLYFTGKIGTTNLDNVDLDRTNVKEADIYLQLRDTTGNEYASGQSRGFLAITLPSEKVTLNTENIAGSVNIFVVPMNVIGQIKQDGKQWLVMDGGVVKYGNMKVADISNFGKSPLGMVNNVLINLMVMFDGMDSGETESERYRIDITGSDLDKGIVKMGTMQRFSPKYGWLSASADEFNKITQGMFCIKVEHGLNANMFTGITLNTCQRKTIPFYPSDNFYGESLTRLGSIVKQLGKMYRESDFGKKHQNDFNIREFTTYLDNNLFKRKIK